MLRCMGLSSSQLLLFVLIDFWLPCRSPIHKKLIDLRLLNVEEKKWVDDYHAEVWEKVSPLLQHDQRALNWLRRETTALWFVCTLHRGVLLERSVDVSHYINLKTKHWRKVLYEWKICIVELSWQWKILMLSREIPCFPRQHAFVFAPGTLRQVSRNVRLQSPIKKVQSLIREDPCLSNWIISFTPSVPDLISNVPGTYFNTISSVVVMDVRFCARCNLGPLTIINSMTSVLLRVGVLITCISHIPI